MKINKKNIMPVVIAITVYLLAYQIPKITVPAYRWHYLNIALDDLIMLYSPAILIYIAAFFQWINCMIIVCKQETKLVYRVASAIMIGSFIGFLTYIIYPTAIHRPEIIGNSIFDIFLRFIYSVDNVVCACPSFHCFCSTIVVLALFECEGIKDITIYINELFSVLVYISTLLTKQHVIIDIPFGILLAFVAMSLSKKIVFTKLFDFTNEKLKIK